MDLTLPLELVAIDPTRRIRRRWRVTLGRDLFGAWLVETHWGRIGTAGQAKARAFTDHAAALAHVRALLARRAGAPRRIGVAYRVR
jgi:predicted DNA-binding WGR domain protein